MQGNVCVVSAWTRTFQSARPTKSTKNWLWGVSSLRRWVEANQIEILDEEIIVRWMTDVYKSGKSMSQVEVALEALDEALHSKGKQGFKRREAVANMLSSFKARYKEKAMDRHILSLQEVKTIIEHPPKEASKEAWETFIWISWCFALRHAEIRKVLPQHIQFDWESKQWMCTIVSPKVNKWRKVEALKWIKAFSEIQKWNWDYAVPKRCVTPAMKKAIHCENEVVVHHSLRHGRCMDLYKKKKYTTDRLMKIGRWRSRGSMLVYVQA